MQLATVRSVLSSSSDRRTMAKTLRPAVAAEKLGYRIDWLRFARALEIEPGIEPERLGSAYGGYVIPRGLVQPDWVCYSAGLGDDVSFEIELIRRYGCTVHGFDPTPAAIAGARAVAESEPRFVPLEYGLWSRDEELRLYAPKDAEHVSHSVANLQGTDDYLTVPVRGLSSVMDELGHDHVDFLKLDIEGAEYELLNALLDDGPRLQLLCVDVHKVESIAAMVGLVQRLQSSGYVPVHLHRTDVTFLPARSPLLLAAAS
jgi:FkbM family methyltransferase